MIFEMCNQFQLLRKTANFSKSENVFVTFDSSYTDDSVLLKYDELKSCLLQVVDIFSNSDIDTSLVMQLLVHSQGLAEDIIACETNKFHSEVMYQTVHQLEWQQRTLMEMAYKDQTLSSTSGVNSTREHSTGLDSEKTARQRVIEATRHVPTEGGLDTIAGLAETKKLLHEAVFLPLKFPHLFTGGLKPCTRILLYGPPGTGKTKLVNAFAVELNVPFYSVTSADLLSTWVGETEKLIRELFEYTRDQAECSVIFIDEVDSICRQRTSREQDLTRRMKTELLTQMDKCDKQIFLMCATNCPWDIDSAFLRRFQRRIYVPLPKEKDRMEIFRIHTMGICLSLSDNDWKVLLDKTDGYSGCDLANLISSALLEPMRDMVKATHWVTTRTGQMKPCASNCPGAVQSPLCDLPADKVVARDVTIADFLTAMQNTHRTISSDDLAKFESFTVKYGQCG